MRRLRIGLVTPAPRRSKSGNRVTALRWARLLRELGHRVAVEVDYRGQPWDVLIALHARKSARSIQRFTRARPGAPVVLALTGTDLYGDIRTSKAARRSLALATRVVVLQPRGLDALPPGLRRKARVILQSARAPRGRSRRRPDVFETCVLAHLRPVKEPLLAARASRLLPAASRVRILHAGAALDQGVARRARAEQAKSARYRWLGERPRARALALLARCRLLVVTSRLEGGANVVSEAIAAGVPVLSTRIDGSVGILGARYPGYFPVGDARALARLLRRAEADGRFYRDLRERCRRLRPLVDPARERRSWKALLRELRP
ncbi:MAG TPA: selenoneine biosynthesis selenosugar synthase SenB [Vicinamibacteria bacterium]